jgi:gamma-glutamyltranspeptidase / glutathione hydrolase
MPAGLAGGGESRWLRLRAMRGVVAAGHPLTAEAGADVLRAGGNAVDAAVASVLMSFVAESPLTGPGAGGFMLVHTAAGEDHLLDFFVAAPGAGLGDPAPADLLPVDVHFSADALQRFNVGPSSCGAYGTPLGLAETLRRFGTATLADLTAAPARAAREGVPVVPLQAYLFEVLEPIFRSTPECEALYAPGGALLREGDLIRLPELGDLLERLGAEGPGFLYDGDVAAAVSEWVLDRGGLLTRADLREYGVIEREPARARFRGREVLTNPPPSSGGILIADALGILERLDRPYDAVAVAEVIASTNRARDADFLAGLGDDGFLERFLAAEKLDAVAGEVRSKLGSTTHVSALDGDGCCAAVTCSNGSCSGVVVPGTGMHLNNMLGEEDLNPLGFHLHEPGLRVPSMMSPTVVLRDSAPEMALGSAGSNRIRSAVLQVILAVVDDGLAAQAAVSRPRLHVEDGAVDAEPGVDEGALRRLAERGWEVRRWEQRNLYFGGVQAVTRTAAGALSGGGDPRRGGVVVTVA